MRKLVIVVCLIGLLIGSTLGGLALADKGGDPNYGSSPLDQMETIRADVEEILNRISCTLQIDIYGFEQRPGPESTTWTFRSTVTNIGTHPFYGVDVEYLVVDHDGNEFLIGQEDVDPILFPGESIDIEDELVVETIPCSRAIRVNAIGMDPWERSIGYPGCPLATDLMFLGPPNPSCQ